jgi:predicted dehydrogenase
VQFLKRGIHVICDKPLTATLKDAKALAKAAARPEALFVLTHNYTGYPMVRQAREMVASGALGDLRLVQVEYVQDWLTEAVEASGQKAGRLAHRSGAVGRGRGHGRYRDPCVQPGVLRHRPGAGGAGGRPAGLRPGPAGR